MEPMDPKWNTMDPKWRPTGPQWSPNGPQMEPKGPQMSPMDPKWSPSGPQWSPNGPQWISTRFQILKNRCRERLLVNFGSHFRPSDPAKQSCGLHGVQISLNLQTLILDRFWDQNGAKMDPKTSPPSARKPAPPVPSRART